MKPTKIQFFIGANNAANKLLLETTKSIIDLMSVTEPNEFNFRYTSLKKTGDSWSEVMKQQLTIKQERDEIQQEVDSGIQDTIDAYNQAKKDAEKHYQNLLNPNSEQNNLAKI